jgi:hypothetical protein
MSTEGDILHAAVDLLTLDTPDPIRRSESSSEPLAFGSALAKLFVFGGLCDLHS